jgi:hypothetical protein
MYKEAIFIREIFFLLINFKKDEALQCQVSMNSLVKIV